MIDHIGMPVSDIARATEFYLKALAPLGIAIVMQVSAEESGHGAAVGFGANQKPFFWIGEGERLGGHVHVAFVASSRQAVDAFYRAALSAGGKDNGPPGLRPHITPIITAPSCSISTATISRRCVISPRERGYLAQRGRENSQVGTPSLRISSCFFGSFSACQS